jgi:hypothetical protein
MRVGLCAALGGACSAALAPRTAHADASAPPISLIVELELGSRIEPAKLKAAIADELGTAVVLESGAKGGTLVVRQEGERVVVSFDRPDGRHEGRAFPLESDPEKAVRDIALLAGNVVRDQAAPFVLRPPPAPPAPEAPEVAAPPAAPTAPPEPAPCDATEPHARLGLDLLPFVGTSTLEVPRSSIRGISLGAVGALSGRVKGLSMNGALGVATSALCGAQLSGAVNVVAGSMRGAQLAGAVNVSSTVSGAQLAGGVNVASSDVAGAQVATVNVAAGRVRGAQIGVVNYAEDADFQLGLINVDVHGRLRIELWGKAETGLILTGVKHGTAHVHYVYGVGVRAGDTSRAWGAFGIGYHAPTAIKKLFVDTELVGEQELVFTSARRSQITELHALVGYSLIPGVAVFAGPAFNVLIAQNTGGPQSNARYGAPSYGWNFYDGSNTAIRAWPGVVLGVEGL